ncbi:hypothetical protein RWE15_05145 [Virgibacillus halophilus]|uniref:Uncharacterized protein n=1 Tax=Tigheibacillus halophilus TaxID=361280 RepID=A0ABU5C418_9BACI|nr:hypothetical protein [Virgibacillus halophilus]
MHIGLIELLTLVAVLYVLVLVVKLDGRIKGIKYTLEQITKKTGIPSSGPIDNELRELINNGYDIKAVKKSQRGNGAVIVGRQTIY